MQELQNRVYFKKGHHASVVCYLADESHHYMLMTSMSNYSFKAIHMSTFYRGAYIKAGFRDCVTQRKWKMAVQLGIWEYVVFSLTILGTILVGGYRIFKDKVKNTKLDYFLFAKRSTGIVPIVLSLIATWLSGVSLLGYPAEAYVSGLHVIHSAFAGFFSCVVVSVVFLPIYYNLNLTSVMEYIELRFNRRLRMLAAVCYCLCRVPYYGIVLFMPAVALKQVAGIGIWHSVVPLAVICTTYTAVGGFKTVVWTDVFQALMIFATIILVAVKGLIGIGGFGVLWERMYNGDRTTFAYLLTGPTVRYTVWSIYAGQFAVNLQHLTDQVMVQRQLASKTLMAAKLSLYISYFGRTMFLLIIYFFGFIIYARYYDCDPVLSGEIKIRDQLAPYFAMEILKDYPGLGGFYIGGIFAATLSTLSSCINSLSTIILQDFIKTFRGEMSHEESTKITKVLAVIIGAASLACVTIFLNYVSILEAYNAVSALAAGPLVGLATLGVLVPFASALGAAIGCICGGLLSVWIVIGASMSKYVHPYAPMGISGCNGTLAMNATLYSPAPYIEHNASVFPLYTVPFYLYIFIGFATTVVVGSLASLLTGPQNPDDLPKGVLYPAVEELLRKLPKYLKSKLGYKIAKNANAALQEEEMAALSQRN